MTTLAIIGPGAVGTSLAHALENCPLDVDLLGRRDETLTFHEYATSETHTIKVKALQNAKKRYDWLMIAVKTTQLDAILPDIARLIHPNTRIILAQNGYGQHQKISHPYVYPAVVYISGQKEAQQVTHFRDYRLLIEQNPSTQALQDIVKPSLLDLRLESDIGAHIWYKLLVNLGINSVTALARETAKVLQDEAMAELCRHLIEEGRQVAQAEGIHFTPSLVEDIMHIYAGYPDDMGTSMYYDLMHQRPLEVENIQGYLYQCATKHQLNTPHLAMAYTLLHYEHQKAQTSI